MIQTETQNDPSHPTSDHPSRRARHVRYASAALIVAALCATGLDGTCCHCTTPGPEPVIVESDHVLGSEDAPLTVVEYTRFHCEPCGVFTRTQFATIKEQYIDTNQVRWVFRQFLSMGDEAAVLAACAAECAGDQGRYLDYYELLFDNQDDLSEDMLKQHAATLGLDQAAFDACLDGGAKVARVQQDVDSGDELGVTSTPRFFVGSEMVRGYRTAAQLGEIIDAHLGDSGGG
ncbi:MAG: thioredoxin domain-containing protein [Phycisphaerae bacterium]|nr:thioredoxin domain-containing protein [Phycisphaerae bacterium]